MTLYLVDVNVFQRFHPDGNANIAKWKATIKDDDIRISALTIFEMRRGFAAKAATSDVARKRLAILDALEKAYADKIVSLGSEEARMWAVTVQGAGKDSIDRGLVAVAKVHGMTIVTRNVEHFRGQGVRILNPFEHPPEIME